MAYIKVGIPKTEYFRGLVYVTGGLDLQYLNNRTGVDNRRWGCFKRRQNSPCEDVNPEAIC
jgi:hypothetical protein